MYKKALPSRCLYLPLFCPFLCALFFLAACHNQPPAEHYGFLAKLGNDTVSLESVIRQGDKITSKEVDRFPRVRVRHTEIELDPDGSIRHLVMDIHTPGEEAAGRECRVTGEVTKDSVFLTKKDGTGTLQRNFVRNGSIIVAHVPQMYSLYELYFAAALRHAAASPLEAGTPVLMRQFYIDREFDRFPLGGVRVRPLGGGRAEIQHDWLSGTGEATMEANNRMIRYSGAGTTYKVEVTRLPSSPDVKSIANRFEKTEKENGIVKPLSVRDTVQAQIGKAAFTIDYSRPLARGRKLLGDVIAYDRVWRTGANAATGFTTSAGITLGGLTVPAGAYTLWTIPHKDGIDLVVNGETGQWGTQYHSARNLGTAKMESRSRTTPVEAFTISVVGNDKQHGTLVMEWGDFIWTAPIVVE